MTLRPLTVTDSTRHWRPLTETEKAEAGGAPGEVLVEGQRERRPFTSLPVTRGGVVSGGGGGGRGTTRSRPRPAERS